MGKRGKLPTRCRKPKWVRKPPPTETTCAHCGVTCVPSRNRKYSHCDECVTTGKAARDTMLRQNRGMTLRQYQEMWERQGGKCAICRDEIVHKAAFEKGRGIACVDHDHETGKVRGLLCHHCNRALGTFGDNVEGLKRALAYLEGVDEHTYEAKSGEEDVI